jgi:hypothetical protein
MKGKPWTIEEEKQLREMCRLVNQVRSRQRFFEKQKKIFGRR